MLFPKEAPGSTIYEISVKKTGNFAFQNIIDYMKDSAKLGQIIVQALQHSVVNANTGATEDVILPLIEHERGTHVIQRIIKTFDMFPLCFLSHSQLAVDPDLLDPAREVLRRRTGPQRLDGPPAVLRAGGHRPQRRPRARDHPAREGLVRGPRRELRRAAHSHAPRRVAARRRVDCRYSEEKVARYYSIIRGILSKLAGHYLELSKQKYSSNVVEKSITNSVMLGDNTIFKELLAVSAVQQLLDNHYGMFVLQKLLQSIPPQWSKEVEKQMKDVEKQLKGGRMGNGPNLFEKWKQLLNKVM